MTRENNAERGAEAPHYPPIEGAGPLGLAVAQRRSACINGCPISGIARYLGFAILRFLLGSSSLGKIN
jgi:hypothetical protein